VSVERQRTMHYGPLEDHEPPRLSSGAVVDYNGDQKVSGNINISNGNMTADN